eukprot:TRINITY_DN5298_c0_g2_i1.p1 TRINITY_DN5298_c0_g2~~TRINITY_DN5298_c0_g2_i1.p1  ORF type:complete len:132 (-),score=19.06 TRINITY_DN5298_c0_g2_i1:47-442(-)
MEERRTLAESCSRCKRAIRGEYKYTNTTPMRYYHADCFVCANCNLRIGTEFKLDNQGNMYCSEDCVVLGPKQYGMSRSTSNAGGMNHSSNNLSKSNPNQRIQSVKNFCTQCGYPAGLVARNFCGSCGVSWA